MTIDEADLNLEGVKKMAQEKVKARKEIQNKIRDILYLDHEASEVDVLEEIIRLTTQLENFLDKEYDVTKAEKEKPTEFDWDEFFEKQRNEKPTRYPSQIEPWVQPYTINPTPFTDRYID